MMFGGSIRQQLLRRQDYRLLRLRHVIAIVIWQEPALVRCCLILLRVELLNRASLWLLRRVLCCIGR